MATGTSDDLNLTNSYYFAFGTTRLTRSRIRPVDIRAHMAAVEASMDYNWLRYRASFFYASGDKNPTDDKANGFDAILDDPNFVGGQFSYWNRNGIRLVSTDVGLVQRKQPSAESEFEQDRGPGEFCKSRHLYIQRRMDAEVTQTVKAIFNANYLRFDGHAPLEYVLFDPRVRHEIGYDLSLGVVYQAAPDQQYYIYFWREHVLCRAGL